MKNNSKWKKICSGILAVCLVAALLLSNQSFGVFAEEDGTEDIQMQESQIEENSAEVSSEEVLENTEEVNGLGGADKSEKGTQESEDLVINDETGFYADDSSAEENELDRSDETSGEENDIAVQSENNENLQSDGTEISSLIDADVALLKWKASGNSTISVVVGENTYTVSDDTTYQTAYTAVYNAMAEVATLISSNGRNTEATSEGSDSIVLTEIGSQTITSDTIWKVSGQISMNGTVTVASSGRLIILGDGTINRKGFDIGNTCSINLKGKLCLQGSVVFNGGNNSYDARFLYASEASGTGAKPEIYVTDIFKIQNVVVNDKNGAGIYASYTDVYMSGGMIGSDQISFIWDDGKTTSYGAETEVYLKEREDKNEYPYLKSITSQYGCVANATVAGQGTYGAGIAMEHSTFHMSGGDIIGNTLYGMSTVEGTDAKGCHGAGAYFLGCEVDITGGKISGNQSSTTNEAKKYYNQYAGAIQLAGSGDCNLTNVEISYNYAQRWVGAIDIYPSTKLTMNKGTVIKYNCAESNCGGIAIDGTGTEMIMNGGKITHNYSGGLGGGIRCLGTFTMNEGEISYNHAKSNAAGLSVQTDENRRGNAILNGGSIHHNRSYSNGGGMGIVTGYPNGTSQLILNGTEVYANRAAQNGGGFYIDAKNGKVDVELRKGNIHENQAKINGGGVYINQVNECIATLQMTSNEMIVEKNSASEKGGGIYLNHNPDSGENTGSIAAIIKNGAIRQNSATQDGGGAYLAGGTLTVSGGTFEQNISVNGGGAYVADGSVRMFGGNIRNNIALKDGGGIYISSNKQAADVIIRSGTISGNKAGETGTASNQGNGGAIAVVSNNAIANQDHVVIGLRHQHQDLDLTTRKFTSFGYTDSIDGAVHTHGSCPLIKDNEATGNGGGIYMASSASVLDIYCLLEENNKADADATGGSIMSVGGNVNIGDAGENGSGNNTSNAVGNILIKSRMLVKGGVVTLYGNTDNPEFSDQILVDIQKKAGSFTDNRFTKITNAVNYKIEYFENFFGSGMFTAIQYEENEDIPSMGTMYAHEGYKIIGWAKSAKATSPDYTTESGTLIGSKDHHEAWDNLGDSGALKLYAIWQKISYIVEYHVNVNGGQYSGKMASDTFTYGENKALTSNAYKVKGKRFLNWNTESNGAGTSYDETYDESKMISKDGDTVKLYAQWVDCTHHGGDHDGILSYSLNANGDTITETCDCGNYSATLKISGADVYYDGAPHPATLTGTLYETIPKISYSYKETSTAESYGNMPDGETEPTKEGYYKASITVGENMASVEYQIKSAASAATIDVTAKKGQHFTDMNGESTCAAAQDDAFTIQYQVQALNKGVNDAVQKGYITAPVLTLGQALPVGTTIIMQTEGKYWYNNHPTGTEISLTSFTQMGGTDSFVYATDVSAIDDAQSYRFIIDFSKVQNEAYIASGQKVEVGLKYAYTNPVTQIIEPEQVKEEVAVITIGSKVDFGVTVSSDKKNQLTVTAPSDSEDTRWNQKNLVWKIKAEDSMEKLSSDAKLTLTTEENGSTKTVISSLNQNGEFIIPFDWTDNKEFTFSLDSEQESVAEKMYILTAVLYVNSQSQEVSYPLACEDNLQKASESVALTIPIRKEPSLKISSTQKVLSKSETLKVNVDYCNIDTSSYSITGVIRKKDQDGKYNESSNLGQKTITQKGVQDISLASTNGAGSYCLWVTVSKNNQTILEVPYYFIIQE